MSNMSYCRFENTCKDMRDCIDHIWDKLSVSELEFRDEFISMCKRVAHEHGGMEYAEPPGDEPMADDGGS